MKSTTMKLKQRVIMTGSLFLTMISLFLIGMQLGAQPDIPQKVKGKSLAGKQNPTLEERRIKGPEEDSLLKLSHSNFPDVKKFPNFPKSLLDSPHKDWNQGQNKMKAFNMLELLAQRNLTGIKGLKGLPARMSRTLDNIPERYIAEAERLRKLYPRSLHNDTVLQGLQAGEQLPPGVKQRNPWTIWESWVKPHYLYPEDAFWSRDMDYILNAMATAPITSFGVGYKGTQLKATMFLGKQRTVFKPMRYPRDEIITGDPYAGFDRHNGEIAGFHLDGILGFRIAPPVVGRKIDLNALRPVTSQTLLSTYFLKDGDTCFYGKCFYCRREEAACAQGDTMEGSVTLWLPEWYTLKTWRHPYQRTYRPGMKARWEIDDGYCQQLLKPTSEYYYGVLEFTDSCVFDFLMGNADRHHYETYAKASKHGRLMHIDNGKSFGNPHHDEMSILAPLTQCCRLRATTWQKLLSLQSSKEGPLSKVLDRSLMRDPVYPILTENHLEAMDRRHSIIVKTVELCIKKHGRDTVIVSSWE